MTRPGMKGEGKVFGSFDEAEQAYELGIIDLRAEIEARQPLNGERIKTSVGRIIFNKVLPPEMALGIKTIFYTIIGPLINPAAVKKVQEHIEDAVKKVLVPGTLFEELVEQYRIESAIYALTMGSSVCSTSFLMSPKRWITSGAF